MSVLRYLLFMSAKRPKSKFGPISNMSSLTKFLKTDAFVVNKLTVLKLAKPYAFYRVTVFNTSVRMWRMQSPFCKQASKLWLQFWISSLKSWLLTSFDAINFGLQFNGNFCSRRFWNFSALTESALKQRALAIAGIRLYLLRYEQVKPIT